MRRIGRLPKQLVITAVLATALAFATPVFVHRNAYNKAVVDYVKNPSSETDATLRDERAKNQRVILRAHIVAASVLFVLMNAGYFLARRWPEESKAPG